jgi:hypothetical protein
MCDANYFIKERLCPVCLNQANSINYIASNNPNVLVIDCPICNPYEFGKFQISTMIIPNLNDFSDENRIWMSENIKNNIAKCEEKVFIHSGNFHIYYKKYIEGLRI